MQRTLLQLSEDDWGKDRLSGADSIKHGEHVPHFYKWQGTGAP